MDALSATVATKADKSYVDTQLGTKADKSTVTALTNTVTTNKAAFDTFKADLLDSGKGIKYFHATSTLADSQAGAVNSIAIGPVATATADNAIAMGLNSQANAKDTIAIGNKADIVKTADRGVAIGSEAKTGTKAGYFASDGGGTIVVGDGKDGVAIGTNATSRGNQNIAIGKNAVTYNDDAKTLFSQDSVAIGTDAKTISANNAVALGANATAKANNAFAASYLAVASGVSSVAIGEKASTVGLNAVAMGKESVGNAQDGVSIGTKATANALNSISIGKEAGLNQKFDKTDTRNNHISIGTGAGQNVDGQHNIGIGTGAGTNVTGKLNIALGNQAGVNIGAAQSEAVGENVAIGNEANRFDTIKPIQFATAIGSKTTTETGATALGYNAKALGANSLALGKDAKTPYAGGVAVGNNAVAEGADLVALGTGSRAVAPTGNAYLTGKVATSAVSVGTPDGALLRRISNVADGSADQDVVTVAQLKRLVTSTGANPNTGVTADEMGNAIAKASVHYVSITGTDGAQLTGQTGNFNNSGALGAKQALAIGPDAQATKDQGIAIGNQVNTRGTGSIGIGNVYEGIMRNGTVGSQATVVTPGNQDYKYGIGIGAGSSVEGNNAIAIGSLAATSTKDANGAPIDRAIAMGYAAATSAQDAISLGSRATSSADSSTAIGKNATVTGGINSIAMGTNQWVTGQGSGSIGYAGTGSPIEYVGKEADSVKQTRVSGNGTYSIGNTNSVVIANESGIFGNNNETGKSKKGDLSASIITDMRIVGNNNLVANNKDATQVTLETLYITGSHNEISSGDDPADKSKNIFIVGAGNKLATKKGAVTDTYVVGSNNTVNTSNTFVLGANVTTTIGKDVILGTDSASYASGTATKGTAAYSTETIKDIKYDYAGNTAPNNVISVGALGKEGRIENVAAGWISATSTDAINGSQLYVTNVALGNLANSTATHLGGGSKVNPDGSLVAPTYNLTTGNPSDGVKGNVNNVSAAIKNLDTAVNQPLTFAPDSGGNVARKLGSTLNVKGGATDLTDNNIGVVSNGSDTLTVKLAKNLNLTDTGSVKIGNTTLNSTGLTITNGPNVTTAGIDAGSKKITNVANGTISADSKDAVNGSQLYAAQALVASGVLNQLPVVYTNKAGDKLVKLGDNFYPAGTTLNADGKPVDATGKEVTPVPTGDVIASMNSGDNTTTTPTTLGNVASNLTPTTSTTTLIGKDGKTTTVAEPTKAQAAPSEADAKAMNNHAATVGDVLNAGWNLQGNGSAIDFVKPYDTVNFANGVGTTVLTVTNGLTSTIRINSLVGVTDKDGNTLVKVGDNYYKPADLNPDGTAKAGVTPVAVGDTFVNIINPAASEGTKGNAKTLGNVGSGLVDDKGAPVALKDAKDSTLTNAVNVGDLKTVVNEVSTNAFGLKDAQGNEFKQNLGTTAAIVGDKNINTNVVDFKDPKTGVTTKALEVSLNNDITIGGPGKDGAAGKDGTVSVQSADGKNGVTLNGKDGSIGINGKDGSSGSITMAQGKAGVDGKDGEKKTRIVYETKDSNGNTVKEEVATLNDGLKFGANAGDVHNAKLNTQVDVKGAAANTDWTKFDKGENIMTHIDGNTITVGLAKDLNNLNSVTFGDKADPTKSTTLSTTADGNLDVGGDKITNVQAGKDDTDAVNVKQLKDAQTKVTGDQGVTVTPVGPDANGSTTYNVAAKTDGKTIKVDDKGFITAVTSDVTASGTADDKEAPTYTAADPTALVNGSTLANTANSLVKEGLNFMGNDGANIHRDLGTQLTIKGAHSADKVSDKNVYVQADAANNALIVKIAENPEFTTVKTGDTTISDNGLVINNGPSVTKVGINAGDKKITNVANGTISADSKDAVNGSQLYATNQHINNVENKVDAGWELTTAGNTETPTVKHNVTPKDRTVKVAGGKNISVKQAGNTVTVSTVDNPVFNTVQIGGNTGPVISSSKGNDGVTELSVGKPDAPTRITNVAPGVKDTDAVNVSQLKAVKGDVVNIDNRVKKLDKRVRGIGASSAAAASLPQVYIPGKSMIATAAGGYDGASALAVGYSKASDNGKLILKLQGTANSEGHVSGGVGIGYQW